MLRRKKVGLLYLCCCHSEIRGRNMMHLRRGLIKEDYCLKQRCHKESGLGSCISIAAGCAATMKTFLIHQDCHYLSREPRSSQTSPLCVADQVYCQVLPPGERHRTNPYIAMVVTLSFDRPTNDNI